MAAEGINMQDRLKEEYLKLSSIYEINEHFMNDYLKIICSSIEKNRTKGSQEYYENHHIIPKCLGGNNEKNNLVLLTAEEHFNCHYILHKMFPKNNSLFYALHKMLRVGKNQVRIIPSPAVLSYIKSEHAKKMSDLFSLPIIEYSTEGIFIKIWKSALLVEKELGIPHSNIGLVIKGKRTYAGNRIWRLYSNDYNIEDHITVSITKNSPAKSIYQCSQDGQIIMQFKSSYEAAKILGLKNSNIIKVCNNKINKTGGLYFKYAN
jgi:hypothetical protein